MAHSITVQYRESEILSADPLKLVLMLYRAAIDAIGAARRHVQYGEIAQRNFAIMRAWNIVSELRHSLDHNAGGDISRNLAGLYAYIQARLLEANAQQIEPPLEEAERLLSTLLEGWSDAASRSGTDEAGAHAEGHSGSAKKYVPVNFAY